MISALYILHYGKEWLHWSMRSIRSFVDEIYVFYTPIPSHGHATTLKNPETRGELYDISIGFSAIWHDCPPFPHEGAHREYSMEICRQAGSDLVVVVDADEIWHPDVISNAISFVKEREAHSYRIGMRHFWRSLKWVCDDGAMPTRFVRPNVHNASEIYIDPNTVGKVFHMGYAQPPAIIEYKQSIHGHKGEWRPGWFEQKFLNWTPLITDVHPTCSNYWNPVKYRDNGELEYLVGDHPYWKRDIIK